MTEPGNELEDLIKRLRDRNKNYLAEGDVDALCDAAGALLSANAGMREALEAAHAIFSKRQGAYGTALLERDATLHNDLEALRVALKKAALPTGEAQS